MWTATANRLLLGTGSTPLSVTVVVAHLLIGRFPGAVRPWSGGGEAEVVARCVEGGAELVGVAADLGEEEAALDAGHGGSGERGGVGVLAQLAAGFHADEAVAEVRFPAFETCGDRCPGGGVALGELAGEGADRAAAARLLLDLVLDHEVEPAVDAGPGVELVKEIALPAEDGVGGDVDDGVDEVVAVIEVVVELAAAGAGACPDVVQAHTGGRHRTHRGAQDAPAWRLAPRVDPRRAA